MSLGSSILYHLAKAWPPPKSVKRRDKVYDKDYHLDYALRSQFLSNIFKGLKFDFYDKEVLEIGCGHGGISTLMAICGAKKVVGIDINKENLRYAEVFSNYQAKRLGANVICTEFLEMSAYDMKFESDAFDLVLADNVFEHFMDPQTVLKESHRVLKPNGVLVVPIFSSIYSKYALHLKVGLKLPWSNLFFSEKTIVQALYRLAQKDNYLFEAYPGLKNKPDKVRDVRKYGDLNDITYSKFKKMASEVGFEIVLFKTISSQGTKIPAAIIRRLPFIRNSIFADIFSIGARAILIKK